MTSSAPPAQSMLEPGTRLDRYELLCVLAHGGMANVWLARVQGKLGFSKFFAVKTILPNVAEDPSFKDMFLDEARIASRIEHPNVVHIPDVGEFAGVPYLVMDLVEGEPLQRLPRACEKHQTKLPLGVALRILADACHGLHAAHELRDESGNLLNVVHRDMSPQNILISTSGVAKVIDFGVAKARDRSTAQTSAGTLKGKISYMPREQALGKDVDRRADTWALGAVLYYLLSGRPPYKEETQLATLQAVMNAAPIPALPTSLPMSLRTLVTRAIAQEPAQRFQTAAEMGAALEELARKLNIVTTHAQVGAFIQNVLGDKFEARKQLIASAVSEAGNRQRAREQLTAVDAEGSDEHSSIKEGIVAVPTAVISAPLLEAAAQIDIPVRPAADSQPGPLEAGTAGTFVTTASAAPRGARWPLVAGAVLGTLGLVGVLLVGITLKARSGAKTPAANVTVAAPASTTEPAATPTAGADPAGAGAGAGEAAKTPAAESTAAAQASASAKPAASAPAKAGAKWTAWAAPSGAKPAPAAKPAGPAGPTKKQDDEAGF